MEDRTTSLERAPRAGGRILVFDSLVRVFHWLLAIGFMAAFTLANLADEESNAFSAHMIVGLVIVFMVILRVIWGFVGTRYARFGSFVFGARETVAYMRGAFRRDESGRRAYVGHNPGSSLAIIPMLVLFLAIGASGWMAASGNDAAKELHEIFVWATVGFAALHIAGVLWHVMRRKENIVAAMITGKKRGSTTDAIPAPRRWAAVAFLLLTGGWAYALYSNYDAAARTLTVPVTGTRLHLGEEDENEGRTEAATPRHSDEEHEERDDD